MIPNNVIPIHSIQVFRRVPNLGSMEYTYPTDIQMNNTTIGTIYHNACKLLLAKVVLSSQLVVANAIKWSISIYNE